MLSEGGSSCDKNPFEMCKDSPRHINVGMIDEVIPQFCDVEENEINLLKRMNSSLKKRSDSSHFLYRGGIFGVIKRPNSIGGLGLNDTKGFGIDSPTGKINKIISITEKNDV